MGQERVTILGGETDDYTCMPANVPHAVEAAEQARMLLIMLRDAV